MAAAVLIIAADRSAVTAVLIAAPLFGVGYGLCMVAGLSTVQSMASGDDLAGVTAVFYSVSYAGFFLPMILAALAPLTGYGLVLGVVAALCLVCALISGSGLRRAASA
ncbi:hypothetical protein [Frondihabitans sp. PAMC 28766]|uniref:hypothetical protein n=1 Tax=Frondihabitans sp. PAMC 28766 TaxID=1795630 RepID=UPI00138F351F|nr:hypothetical protein [Frondihabitans sp. PAMC 28766]